MVIMTNKQRIENKLENINCSLGCYDSKIDKLSQKELKKVLDNLEFDTDVEVTLNRKKHIIEVFFIDNEVDLSVKSLNEYSSTYGNNK